MGGWGHVVHVAAVHEEGGGWGVLARGRGEYVVSSAPLIYPEDALRLPLARKGGVCVGGCVRARAAAPVTNVGDRGAPAAGALFIFASGGGQCIVVVGR